MAVCFKNIRPHSTEGRLFHEFAVTLSSAILVSGVISLTLTPMMCARFLRHDVVRNGAARVFRTAELHGDVVERDDDDCNLRNDHQDDCCAIVGYSGSMWHCGGCALLPRK